MFCVKVQLDCISQKLCKWGRSGFSNLSSRKLFSFQTRFVLHIIEIHFFLSIIDNGIIVSLMFLLGKRGMYT